MTIPITRYPLDATGVNSDNFVNGEIHSLSNKLIRAVAPKYGAFFTESLRVYDNRDQRLLVRGTHYICAELLQTATQAYGKEICYLILIIDPTVNPEVIIQYQVLGGLYTNSGDAIIKIYEAITKDERPVDWINVLNKPLEFAPGSHLHDGRDIYGLEYIVTALERIRSAIVISDVPAYENMMDWVNTELIAIRGRIDTSNDSINTEYTRAINAENILRLSISDEVTQRLLLRDSYIAADIDVLYAAKEDATNKITVSNSNVINNIKLALPTEPNAGPNKYLSGVGTWDYIYAPTKTGEGATGTWNIDITGNSASATKLATARNINGVAFDGTTNITINAVDSTARIASSEKAVANGVATLGSDGKVPAIQLPSYVDDVLEFVTITDFPVTGEVGKIYVAADTNKTYRWSGSVYVYITSGAVDSVAGKTGVVTLVKADVGLGEVENFSIASSAEATSGTATNRYMTPQRTKGAIDTHSASSAHDGRYTPKDSPIEGSIHAPGTGIAYVFISGAWRQFWPPLWQ